MAVQPFPLVEIALKEVISAAYAPAENHVGGDMSYNGTDDLYVQISLFGGSGDPNGARWTIDLDFYSTTYGKAMEAALAVSALLVSPGAKRGSEMIIDSVFENDGPAERPWNDETVFRVGSTYSLSARRRD